MTSPKLSEKVGALPLWLQSNLLEKYFSEYTLVDHQISSYYDFINETIPSFINGYTITDEKESHQTIIRLQNVCFGLPANKEEKGFEPVTPNEARLRSLTYSMPMYCDVAKLSPDGKEIEVSHRISFRRNSCDGSLLLCPLGKN